MRAVIRAMALALIGGVLAVPAYGSQPTREPVQYPDSFTFDGICSFAVNIDVLTNNETFTTFSDGRQQVNGAAKFRLTNLDDPEHSIVVNASGPARLVTLEDGTVHQTGFGLGLQPFPAEASITGTAEFLLLSGPEVIEFYPDGSFKEIERGHVKLDVCAALG